VEYEIQHHEPVSALNTYRGAHDYTCGRYNYERLEHRIKSTILKGVI
jgi:hypothetical protein